MIFNFFSKLKFWLNVQSADREIRLLFPEYFDQGLSLDRTVEDMESDHRLVVEDRESDHRLVVEDRESDHR